MAKNQPEKYYVIESHDTNTSDAYRTFSIYTSPGTTNQSHEAREEGWLGTTNNIYEYAHGVFESIDAARAKIQKLAPGTEIRNDEDDSYREDDETLVEEYAYNNIWSAADWLQNSSDSDLEISADTTDAQLSELAKRFEAEANEEGVTIEDDVETYLRERRDSLREEN